MRLATTFGSLLVLVSVASCASPPPSAATADMTRSTLAAHRELQIARLHAYATAGKFPHNTTTTPDLHMFKDASGRRCAVADLIHEDGRDDLVDATVQTKNDLAIADVKDGPMMDWVLSSGFTQEELARIQLPNMPMKMTDFAPPPPRPVPDVAKQEKFPEHHVVAVDEDQMKAAVRAHIAKVEAELRANTAASLDKAVAREMASHTTEPSTGLASIFSVL